VHKMCSKLQIFVVLELQSVERKINTADQTQTAISR